MNGLEGITEDLLERGCISAEDARVAQKYYSREGEMRKKAQKFIADKKLTCPDPGERLAVTLCAAEIARVRYAERGISDSIFYDTMSDIGVWTADCRRTKITGCPHENIRPGARKMRFRLKCSAAVTFFLKRLDSRIL